MKLCIIPARGGSQRIPRKNIRPFMGKPIIAHSIEIARHTGLFDVIAVTTEDPEIAEVAYEHGATLVIARPAHLASNEVGTQYVASDVCKRLRCEYACVIYATAPLIDNRDVYHAYRTLSALEGFEYCFGVNREPLFDAGAFYWGTGEAFRACKPLVASKTIMYPLPPERVCDINTPVDWERAEQMYAALHNKEAA